LKLSFTNPKIVWPLIPFTYALVGGKLYYSQGAGNRFGDEVVQLYIHQQAGSASRPVRLLKGFERITLTPQQKQTVHFELGKDELSYWNTQSKSWIIETGTFDVWVSNDSNAALHSTFVVSH
jgi:beta-glucosidase